MVIANLFPYTHVPDKVLGEVGGREGEGDAGGPHQADDEAGRAGGEVRLVRPQDGHVPAAETYVECSEP